MSHQSRSGLIDGKTPSEFREERERQERIREAREERAERDTVDEPTETERRSALADTDISRGGSTRARSPSETRPDRFGGGRDRDRDDREPDPEPVSPERAEARGEEVTSAVRRDPDVRAFDPTRDVERIAPGAFIATFETDRGGVGTRRFFFDDPARAALRRRAERRRRRRRPDLIDALAGIGPVGRGGVQPTFGPPDPEQADALADVGGPGTPGVVVSDTAASSTRTERIDALADAGGPGTGFATLTTTTTVTPDMGETPELDRLVRNVEGITGADAPGEGNVTRPRFPGEGEQRIFGPDFPINLPSDFEPGSTDVGLRGIFEGAGPVPSGGTERFETIFGRTETKAREGVIDPVGEFVGATDAKILGPVAETLAERPTAAEAVKSSSTAILGPVASAPITAGITELQAQDPKEARETAEGTAEAAGLGATQGVGGIATLPVTAPLKTKEVTELGIGALEAREEGREGEFQTAVETEALDIAARSTEEALQNPIKTGAMFGGSLLASGGAIAGATRLGGPVVGRGVSIGVQPFEEATIFGARRGLISRGAATKVPGVREGMLGPAERGQLDLTLGAGRRRGDEPTRLTAEDVADRSAIGDPDPGPVPRSRPSAGRKPSKAGLTETGSFVGSFTQRRPTPPLLRREGELDFSDVFEGPEPITRLGAETAEPGLFTRGLEAGRLTEPELDAFAEPVIGTEPRRRTEETILDRIDRAAESTLTAEAGVGLAEETALGAEVGREGAVGFDVGLETLTDPLADQRADAGAETAQEIRQEQGLEFAQEFGQEQRQEFGQETGQETGLEVGREIGREVGLEIGLEFGREFGLETDIDAPRRSGPLSDGFLSGFVERQFVSPVGPLGIGGGLTLGGETGGPGFVGPVTGGGPLFETGGFDFDLGFGGGDRKRKKRKRGPLDGWNFEVV